MLLVLVVPNHNVGLAIIALTVIIRIILLPSSLNASRQQRHMQLLQPQLSALQEKYKGDKQKQAEVLAQFYKDNKVNPLGSCLPLLIQLPILIVLYQVFIHGLDMSRFSLLYSWVPRPSSIQTMFLGLNLAKPDRFILPVIAGLLQFYQGYQIQPKTEAGKQPEMAQMVSKQMLYMMPLFTILIAGRFPAALPLYWIITTLFAIGQQWWINRENPKLEIIDQKLEVIGSESGSKNKLLENKSIKHGVEITVRKKS
jgi:YidC/Oxa1 family membrane protein insertase